MNNTANRTTIRVKALKAFSLNDRFIEEGSEFDCDEFVAKNIVKHELAAELGSTNNARTSPKPKPNEEPVTKFSEVSAL